MVGGAMFPQCLPRRSADSLSPSRISMKSYLRGDREKDTDEQSDHSDHSEGLGRTVLPLWLSPFFRRHSGAAVSTKGTLLALVHRQTQTREVVFKLHRVHGCEALSLVHKSIASLSQDLRASVVCPWVAVAHTFYFHRDLSKSSSLLNSVIALNMRVDECGRRGKQQLLQRATGEKMG